MVLGKEPKMSRIEALIALIGSEVVSPLVRAMIDSEQLEASFDPDLDEGEPIRKYLSSRTGGFQFRHINERIDTLWVYLTPSEGFHAFSDPLTSNLMNLSSRHQVLLRFGTPERSGEVGNITGLGYKGAWDRFLINERHFHFQYSLQDERLELLTVMAVGIAP